jgi:hypothetical protein
VLSVDVAVSQENQLKDVSALARPARQHVLLRKRLRSEEAFNEGQVHEEV